MCKYLFLSLVSLLLGMHLEVELLDHVVLCVRNCHTIFHSTLAWKIPWTEEPGRLRTKGSWRVGHDWTTSLSLFPFMHWRRKWQPTPVFLPGESHGQGAWWAAVYRVAQSRTRLKWLSSSSSMWNECNCVVVLTFFGIAFLWDWDKNWPFLVLWPLLSFLSLLAYWVQHFHSIIFKDLK